MNATDNQTRQCPEESPMSTALLWMAVVHCYCVTVFGTLGNVLALWCVGKCTKTGRPVKVLVYSVFVPALLLCLVLEPLTGEMIVARIKCNPHRISWVVLTIGIFVSLVLILMELASIAAVSVVRAVSIRAPQKQKLGLRGAVLLVTGICLYSILTTLGMMGLGAILDEDYLVLLIPVLSSLFIALPILITIVAYILMIYVIQQNKRRMVACQQPERVTTAMDQATRAMLAVFISNLVFGLPTAITNIMHTQSAYAKIIIHVLHATHYVVDPLAYISLHSDYRKKVLSLIPCRHYKVGVTPSPDQAETIDTTKI